MPDELNEAVNARIVYWGTEQAGVSTTLRRIFDKLRPDHRGELREVPTRLDPTVGYEVLPIKLGEVGGVDTRIEIVAVPGSPEHAPTRKQLLDRADGIVFVADARRDRLDEDVARFAELRQALLAYGRSLDAIPLVIQMNRCDQTDAATREALLRKLDAQSAPAFDTVASEGKGVLQVLSTISKSVVRSLREPPGRSLPNARPPLASSPPAPAPESALPPAPLLPHAPLPMAAATAGSDDEWPAPIRSRRLPASSPFDAPAPAPSTFEELTGRLDPIPAPTERIDPPLLEPIATPPALRIVSTGTAICTDGRTLQLPLELEDAQGGRFSLTVTLALDPLLGG
jgi:signal recognition particle receptor subunit beta